MFYLKFVICQFALEVIKLSVLFTKAIGPGSKNSGKKQQNENISCSKKVSIPSRDWTHIKSRFCEPPNGPTIKCAVDLFNECS